MRIFLHPSERLQWYEAFYNNITKSLGLRTAPVMEYSEVLEDLKLGKLIVVVDDESRENEGDLIGAADKCTPDMVNFMARYGR